MNELKKELKERMDLVVIDYVDLLLDMSSRMLSIPVTDEKWDEFMKEFHQTFADSLNKAFVEKGI